MPLATGEPNMTSFYAGQLVKLPDDLGGVTVRFLRIGYAGMASVKTLDSETSLWINPEFLTVAEPDEPEMVSSTFTVAGKIFARTDCQDRQCWVLIKGIGSPGSGTKFWWSWQEIMRLWREGAG